MPDWVAAIAETVLDIFVLDRLTTQGGWLRAVIVLAAFAMLAFAIWWGGRLMRWW